MTLSTKIRGLRDIWQFRNRWYLAFTRSFFPNENVLIYRLNGIEFLSDHAAGDTNGARELLTSPMYRQYLPQMDLPASISVIDLGTNNGGFPLLLKSQGLKILKLLCVELNPNTFTRLRFNLDRNFGGAYTAVNGAVCGERRTITVNLGGGSVGDNIYQSYDNGLASYSLEGRTFDDLYEQVFGDEIVDICKIDIEGAEFEVFGQDNAGKVSRCRYLLMEIHHEKDRPRDKVLKKLSEMGFVESGGENKNEPDKHYVHFFVNTGLQV